MAKLLCYTSPGRGHLYPTVPVLLEMGRRGHDVSLRTLSGEVARMTSAGLRTRPIDAAIEAATHDDWGASSPTAALGRAVGVFVARAEHEIPDLQGAIATERPDLVLVDFNCWGAAAVAERSGLPWALFLPYFLPWRLPGLPPFGPGLAPRRDLLGRLRDTVMAKLVHAVVNRNLPALNSVRARVGVPPFGHMTDLGRTAPRILYYTAEPFEYACPARPPGVVPVGPCFWDPPGDSPAWLERVTKPLVLVTCSTEFQDDGRLVDVALEALAEEDVFVVVTTAAVDPPASGRPATRTSNGSCHTARSSDGPRRSCAMAGWASPRRRWPRGFPSAWCRSAATRPRSPVTWRWRARGTRLLPKKLTPARLRAAVAGARECRAGAERIADAFRAAGGPVAAADALESLLPGRRRP